MQDDDAFDKLRKQGIINERGQTDIARLVPNRPDAELAAELRKEIIEACNPILDVLEKVHKSGFQANVAFGMGPVGKMMLTNLQILKVF